MEINYKREAAHFTGGIIVGCVAQGIETIFGHNIGVISKVLIGCFLLAFILVKEILEDNVTQPRQKTILDSMSWITAYILVTIW